MKNTILIYLLLTISVSAQSTYIPPGESRDAVRGVGWELANPIGENFREIFLNCDKCKKGVNFPCPSITKPSKVIKNGCAGDMNKNSALLKFADSTIFFNGKMSLDADGSAYARARQGDGVNQSETSFQINGHSLDASKVPFIVIPQDASRSTSFKKTTGLRVGDIAVVIYKGQTIYAIVGDEGPSCRIGEGSIKLHEALGHHVCKNEDCTKLLDASIERDVLYFVFPNSDIRKRPGVNLENINDYIRDEGNKLWAKFTTK